MKIYIITQEPYHDGSSILDVFETLKEAVERLKHYEATNTNPKENYDDYRLTEWYVKSNKEGRVWDLYHRGGPSLHMPHNYFLADGQGDLVEWPNE